MSFLHDITLEQLVERAVKNAHCGSTGSQPYWSIVADHFGLGSTYAMELCKKFGVNPDKLVDGAYCEHCIEEREEAGDLYCRHCGGTQGEHRPLCRDVLNGLYKASLPEGV